MTIQLKFGGAGNYRTPIVCFEIPVVKAGLYHCPTGAIPIQRKETSFQTAVGVEPVVFGKVAPLPKCPPSRCLHSRRVACHEMPAIGEPVTPDLQSVSEQENPHGRTGQQIEDTLFHTFSPWIHPNSGAVTNVEGHPGSPPAIPYPSRHNSSFTIFGCSHGLYKVAKWGLELPQGVLELPRESPHHLQFLQSSISLSSICPSDSYVKG